MRNRWYHTPKLHSPDKGEEKKVSWLELFYDLVYVATLIQLGNYLANNISVTGVLAFAGLFMPIWLGWTSFTFYVNRFDVDDFLHRGLVFLQMFGVAAMAVLVGRVAEDPHSFAVAYALTRICMLILYLRVYRQLADVRPLARAMMIMLALDAALWIASTWVPTPWVYALWGAGALVSIGMPMNQRTRELSSRFPPDREHMAERYGLLTIIVLGEGFVKVLSHLFDTGAGAENVAMGALGLLITCSIWWIYFDDVAGSRIRDKKKGAAYIWVYMHLPLMTAIAGVGVALKKAIDLDIGAAAPAKYCWLLGGMLAAVFLSVAIIDHFTERRQAELSDRARVNVRVGSATALLLVAAVGPYMPAFLFMSILAGVCVSQVFFDLLMAPHEAEPEHHHSPHDHQRAPRRTTLSGDMPRRDISEALRRGTPSALRRDMYFFMMQGSWGRLLALLVASFLFLNLIFACLFMLDPTSIANATDGSFGDAFSFSVQTMSTIGFGTLSPANGWGDALVTAEAVIGLLFSALATGLMFAKASRPHSSVLFSEVAVITNHDGKRTLMFRCGNTRGNDVVEATMRVSALKDVVSAEGQIMRRLFDVKLVRDNSPLFALSWTVFHIIDDESPFYGCAMDGGESDTITGLIATMLGHDSTYGSTTHARHVYYADDIIPDYCFVDVIEQLDDGRLLIDFTRFHNVVPVNPIGDSVASEHNETEENEANLAVIAAEADADVEGLAD